MYVPPFTVSAQAINIIAEISAMIERYTIAIEGADKLRLRKANRVKTIHSSLAIEGNTLSEDEVRDIINGVGVVAPVKQIQEVRNAIRAYELYSSFNPFDERDLLKAHSIMMEALADDAGHYRSSGVGVFGDKGLVHMAPPARMVPSLMGDLFGWLKSARDHLLIRSCVFHYEFEFIHPFSDGNGRMGRLWQSLILGRLNRAFEHLPVENMVYSNQQDYYEAIARSTGSGDCGPFIDFMLGEIKKSLEAHLKVPDKVPDKVPNKTGQKIMELLRQNPRMTIDQISQELGMTARGVGKAIEQLREAGLIERRGSNKSGHWEIRD